MYDLTIDDGSQRIKQYRILTTIGFLGLVSSTLMYFHEAYEHHVDVENLRAWVVASEIRSISQARTINDLKSKHLQEMLDRSVRHKVEVDSLTEHVKQLRSAKCGLKRNPFGAGQLGHSGA